MAARTLSNRTTISNTLQSLGRRCSLNRMAGAALGVVADRPMTTESSDTVTSEEKSVDVDRRPATSSAPAHRGRRDEFLPAFFSDPWDPFGPARTLGQVLTFMDQLMDVPFSGRGGLRTGWDAREDDKSLCLKVEMPGLGKDDVKVWIEGNTLVMKGEKEEEIETSNAEDDGTTTAAEGNRGRLGRGTSTRRYSSRIEIPERGYKLDQIKAEMKHGVLRVVVPKAQAEERGDVVEVPIDG